MKLFLYLLFITETISAQNINPDTLSFYYSEVINVDSASAKVLYSNAKIFIAESFVSNKEVVQLDDPNSFTLLAKGNFVPIVKNIFGVRVNYGYVNFTIKIQCKEGRYKYTISEFIHDAIDKAIAGGDMHSLKPACGTLNMPKSYWNKVKIQTDDQMKIFTASFKKAMANVNLMKKDDF